MEIISSDLVHKINKSLGGLSTHLEKDSQSKVDEAFRKGLTHYFDGLDNADELKTLLDLRVSTITFLTNNTGKEIRTPYYLTRALVLAPEGLQLYILKEHDRRQPGSDYPREDGYIHVSPNADPVKYVEELSRARGKLISIEDVRTEFENQLRTILAAI
jgi:hypothetical protein